jgi:hypothetical protein
LLFNNCKSSNKATGYCLSCYNGYVLLNNNCLLLSYVIANMQNNNRSVNSNATVNNNSSIINNNSFNNMLVNNNTCITYDKGLCV